MESAIRTYLQGLATSNYATISSRIQLSNKSFDDGEGNNKETKATLELLLIFNISADGQSKTSFINTVTLENFLRANNDIKINNIQIEQELVQVRETVINGLFTRILKIQYSYYI